MLSMGRVEMRRTAECMDGDGGFFSVPVWLGYAWMRFFLLFFRWGGARLFGGEDISETQHSHHGTASTSHGTARHGAFCAPWLSSKRNAPR